MNGIIAGVQEIERTRGGVTVLMNDKRHTGVIEFECVSSRILRVKFKLSEVKVCVVVEYGPTEREFVERERCRF